MAFYKVEIAKSVERDLRRIDKKYVPQMLEMIKSLSETPFPANKYKKLKGSMNCCRIRVGDYRILYTVEHETKVVHVYKVRHRKDAYA